MPRSQVVAAAAAGAGAECAQSLDAGCFVADERGALHLLHPLAADVRPEYGVVCESRVACGAAGGVEHVLMAAIQLLLFCAH